MICYLPLYVYRKLHGTKWSRICIWLGRLRDKNDGNKHKWRKNRIGIVQKKISAWIGLQNYWKAKEKTSTLHFFCTLGVFIVLVTQSCPTLCDPMDHSPPGSSVCGILQERILEWVAILFSRGIFLTQVLNPCLLHCGQILYHLSHHSEISERYIFISFISVHLKLNVKGIISWLWGNIYHIQWRD